MAVGVALVAGALALAGGARADDVVDVPLSFRVANVNRTPDPCTSDGVSYTLRGHLTAPRPLLVAPRSPPVTLYLHGSILGEAAWRFRAAPGYDTTRELARAGHVSVTIDQLGYGSSDAPQGMSLCGGSMADMAHQVVGQLREGTYGAGSWQPRPFGRVALFGFSFGGHVAETEAYSFGDVDALGIESWSDHVGATFAAAVTPGTEECASGQEKTPAGAPFYRYHFLRADEGVMLADADPLVAAALYRAHERDPCGIHASFSQIERNPEFAPLVRAPVLLVYGTRDALFAHADADAQAADFTGADDLTLRFVEGGGHFLALEREAPAFRAVLERWLAEHGL
ncbi:MAG TPA: alpha/beta hydrolase [Thermoleophilaceae bacterium]|nr:alpha/beta hydrolase [Thermoleophilaceae bacterium]